MNVLLRRPRWFAAVLYFAAMLFQTVAIRRAVTYYDENLELYDAEQVLHGHLPYRDFWTMYGPAQSYSLAAFCKVFGISVLTGRLYDSLVKAAIALFCYLLVQRMANRRAALVAFAVALLALTCTTSAIYNFPIFPALLCGLVSLYSLTFFLENNSNVRLLFFSGLLTGLATTYRHDSGFYLCLTHCSILFWTQRSQLVPMLRTYIGGLCLIVLPVFAWLLWEIPRHDLYFNLLYMPGVVYPRVRTLPFPSVREFMVYMRPFGERSFYAIEDWIVYFPIAVCLTALATLATRTPLWKETWRRHSFGAMVLLNALLFLKGIVRVTEIHEMQAIVLASASVCILWSLRMNLHRVTRVAVTCCCLALGVYSALLLWHAETFIRWNVRDSVRPNYHESLRVTCHPPTGLERIRCMVVDASTIEAVQYVQHLTSPGEPIYVGAGRHDKLALNDVRFYVIAARPSITRWYDLHPGVQTTLGIQNEMIESMRTQSPKVIVLNDAWDDVEEPNASRYSSGITVLDDYIHSHYVETASFGPYTMLVPRIQAAGSDSK